MSTQSYPTFDYTPSSIVNYLIYIIGVAMTSFTIYYAYAFPLSRLRYSNIFLGFGLTLFYLLQIRSTLSNETEEKSGTKTNFASRLFSFTSSKLRISRNVLDLIACIIFSLLSIISTGYVEYHFDRLQGEASLIGWTQADLLIGIVIILLVIEATRRAYGNAIALVAIGSIVYAFAGPWFPSIFRHTGMGWEEISRTGAIGLTGVYGFIFGVGSTWVAIFIMFAGMAKSFGLMDFIISISKEVQKVFRSGVIHIAVVGSMIMGSITGSAAANTATTGSFTIPMMKDQGVEADFAAAIESVASSGGQMMPPVMGVAAFLMADIIGVPYLQILQAGILPAALFYSSVFVAVHLALLRFGWTVSPTGEFDRSVFMKGIHFIVPISVLIYTLVVMRLTPIGAGLYTIISLVVTMYIRNIYTDGASINTVYNTTKQTITGLKQGAVEMAPLTGMLAALGIVLAMLNQTGLSQRISTQMLGLAGGIFIFVLLISMISSILFGLGMPTPAAYIIVVILVAPSLITFGINQITAHMFVFYFAMLSAITPPIAVAVAVGSQIADAKFLTSCKHALRIGASGFVIPFSFVANPSVIYWSFPNTIIAVPILFISVISISVSMINYNGNRLINRTERIIYLILAVVGIVGPLFLQILAVATITFLLGKANTTWGSQVNISTTSEDD